MHESTIQAYEEVGAHYVVRRGVQDPDRVTAFADALRSGEEPDERTGVGARPTDRAGRLPILDLGCGPGHHLPLLGPDVVGADAARAMVDAARTSNPDVPVVRCDLSLLPFGRASFQGVWASKTHQHLPGADLPLALAELRATLVVGGRLELTMFTRPSASRSRHGLAEEVSDPNSGDDIPGRWFTWWDPDRLVELVTHAGFQVDSVRIGEPDRSDIARLEVSATAVLALPDHVGPDMRLLCCGINPSIHAAEAGVGYVTASNRFWAALRLAGLSDVDRDPRRLLRGHGIGMTDLVKRPTAKASDLERHEYDHSFSRLEGLCDWLRPRALVVVGIGPWRLASGDRRAAIGWQPEPVGPTPVYVMPSTSGLNAHVPLAELAEHLRAAAAGPPRG